MHPYECKKVENCFVATHVYEYRLKIKADEEFLEGFRTLGSLNYHKNFPRPFFQAVLANGTTVKGVIADTVIKVSFPDTDPLGSKHYFETLLENLLMQRLVNEGR